MVKIFKEESSNEEKENNQSDLYSCDFSSVDSNMPSSFFVNDFELLFGHPDRNGFVSGTHFLYSFFEIIF